ncbi:Uncharacterised protein [Bordetella pertussis]|nr:Uncharacterised protein [Bordetella pertussis]
MAMTSARACLSGLPQSRDSSAVSSSRCSSTLSESASMSRPRSAALRRPQAPS